MDGHQRQIRGMRPLKIMHYYEEVGPLVVVLPSKFGKDATGITIKRYHSLQFKGRLTTNDFHIVSDPFHTVTNS
ncbi:hypothetical protein ES702_07070 [subsurface metagenome]